ncbi:MAG: ABC transporter permease [Blastopirellula sp.]|nr:MAG: ABC transporter permease [Blastopirellula sp.]
MAKRIHSKNSLVTYLLGGFFSLYVLFLYGPMFIIFLLSFQGPTGGMTFPIQEYSLHWFKELFSDNIAADVSGSFQRSIILGLMVMTLTVTISVIAALGFRRNFKGSGIMFYGAIISLIMPGFLISFGMGLILQLLDIESTWYTTALGAQLTWTLPFGLLIMFAVLARFDRSVEEAARDLGATSWQTMRYVVVPLLLPGITGVALFGFTLSYDEIPRTTLVVGDSNTLPMEILAMTNTLTTPSLYAIGTLTTVVSVASITFALFAIKRMQDRLGSSQIASSES